MVIGKYAANMQQYAKQNMQQYAIICDGNCAANMQQ
jgi:hypothetical protein